LVNPIGDETKIDEEPSEGLFMDSDAKKVIDDNLIYITRNLPKFSSLHGLTSGVIMGTAENIQNPLERVHAYRHIRKTLKDAIPLLVASASESLGVITQTQLDVSTAKQALDEHDQKARARAASEAAASAGADDEDLAEGLDTSDAYKAIHEELEATHKSEVVKLNALSTRHTTLLNELSLWEGTLKEVKRLIAKRKK
jgi:hypothetical protein